MWQYQHGRLYRVQCARGTLFVPEWANVVYTWICVKFMNGFCANNLVPLVQINQVANARTHHLFILINILCSFQWFPIVNEAWKQKKKKKNDEIDVRVSHYYCNSRHSTNNVPSNSAISSTNVRQFIFVRHSDKIEIEETRGDKRTKKRRIGTHAKFNTCERDVNIILNDIHQKLMAVSTSFSLFLLCRCSRHVFLGKVGTSKRQRQKMKRNFCHQMAAPLNGRMEHGCV